MIIVLINEIGLWLSDIRTCLQLQKDFVPLTVWPPHKGVVLEKEMGGRTDQVVVVKNTAKQLPWVKLYGYKEAYNSYNIYSWSSWMCEEIGLSEWILIIKYQNCVCYIGPTCYMDFRDKSSGWTGPLHPVKRSMWTPSTSVHARLHPCPLPRPLSWRRRAHARHVV